MYLIKTIKKACFKIFLMTLLLALPSCWENSRITGPTVNGEFPVGPPSRAVTSNVLTKTLIGLVSIPEGTGVEGVAISVVGTKESYAAITGSDGKFIIDKVKQDIYTITAAKSGYVFLPEKRVLHIKDDGSGENLNVDYSAIKNGVSAPPAVNLPSGYDPATLVMEVAPVTLPGNINYHAMPIGYAYDVTLAGQDHVDFGSSTAALSFTYDKQKLGEQGLLEEFMVYYLDETTGIWEQVDRIETNTATGTVTAYTSHFSMFVLTAMPAPTGTVTAPPSCIESDFPSGIGGSAGAVFTILDENFKYYKDRDYFIKPVSQSPYNASTFAAYGFEQAVGISTCNGGSDCGTYNQHKLYAGDDYIVFTAHTNLDVYLMYDTRGGANRDDNSQDAPWIALSGFADTGHFVETTDSVKYYKVYKKTYAQGEAVHLHGNRKGVTDPDIQTNYWVILKKSGDTSVGNPSSLCIAQPDTTPPSLVTNLVAVPGAGVVTLTWQNPDDPDFAGVIIRKGTISPPMNVGDGIEPTGTVVSPQCFRDENVIAGNTYYYTVFSLDNNNNYLAGASVNVTTSADSDGDGLSDVYETGTGTNPYNADTDGDGISDGIEISLGTNPLNGDLTAPSIDTFSLTSGTPTNNRNITFSISGSDNVGITHWMVTQMATKPLANNTSWSATAPAGYVLPDAFAAYTLHAWAKDAAGNVSNAATLSVEYVDNIAPVLSTFILTSPNPSVSHDIAFDLDGSDNIGITAWLITETPGVPNVGNPGWSGTKPGSHTLSAGFGTRTVYAWARDAAGNISAEKTIQVQLKDPTKWAMTYGGTGDEIARSVVQTSDGGYIITGNTNSTDGDVSGQHGSYDGWVIKTDGVGTIAWKRAFGGTGDDSLNSVQQTPDGGYILAGHTASYNGDVSGKHGLYDMWIVKLNASGTIAWQKCLGGPGDDFAQKIRLTSDGGYVVIGYSAQVGGDVTSNQGECDFWVVKLNQSGAILWQKSMGGSANDMGMSIEQTSEGGYIATGQSMSSNGNVTGAHGGYDYWTVKLNSSGSIEWQKAIGGTGDDRARGAIQTGDGGYLITGWSNSTNGDIVSPKGSNDCFLVKLDTAGNIQWRKNYGGSNPENAISVRQMPDGGFVVAAYGNSTNGDVSGSHGTFEFWLFKIDVTGTLIWQKCFGGSSSDLSSEIALTSDGGLITVGSSSSNNGDVSGNHGGNDYWVVKLDANNLLY